jgi:hypothetical protein
LSNDNIRYNDNIRLPRASPKAIVSVMTSTPELQKQRCFSLSIANRSRSAFARWCQPIALFQPEMEKVRQVSPFRDSFIAQQSEASWQNYQTLLMLEIKLLMGCNMEWGPASTGSVANSDPPVLPAAASNADADGSSDSDAAAPVAVGRDTSAGASAPAWQQPLQAPAAAHPPPPPTPKPTPPPRTLPPPPRTSRSRPTWETSHLSQRPYRQWFGEMA